VIYLIVDVKGEQIFKLDDYQNYQDQLESLGSHSDGDYFHIMGLNEEKFSTLLYVLTGSGEAPYNGYKLVYLT
jgi:hypothetical protein